MRIVTDTSSILKKFLYLKDEEFGVDVTHEGKQWHIPDVETCLERFEASVEKTLDLFDCRWQDIILVLDPEKAGYARRLLNPEYRTGRATKPKEFFDCYNEFLEKAKELVMFKGGITAEPKVRPSAEADDLVNELCCRLKDTIAWHYDKDLLACPATYQYYDGEINPEKFPCEQQHIHLYRTLVSGDKSDGISSCKGFGPKAWEGLIALAGYDIVDDLDKMLKERRLHELVDDIESYKPLGLIYKQRDALYDNYQVMEFIHIPAHKVIWDARVWESKDTLVTSDNFEECLAEVIALADEEEMVCIDYEAVVGAESKAWSAANGDVFDTLGFQATGMGLMVGNNNYYFCVNHFDTNNIPLEDFSRLMEAVRYKKIVAQNLTNFEQTLTYTHFGWMFKNGWDTAIMASYVDENSNKGLKGLSLKHLKYKQTSYDEAMGELDGMDEISGLKIMSYGLDDTNTTSSLYNLFTVIMMYENTLEVFKEVELKASYFTALCFAEGCTFDREAYDKLVIDNDNNRKKLEPVITDLLNKVGWENPSGRKPIKSRTAAAIKKLYLAATGDELISAANTVKGIIPDIDNEEVAAAVEAGAPAMDELYKKHFVGPAVPINTRSPKQMFTLFYETMGLPVRGRNKPTDNMVKRGDKGSPKTDEHAIENAIAFGDAIGDNKRLLESLVAYKETLTRSSLFLEKYIKLVHWRTGKLHCSMRQSATTTRRFTHSNPNLAQISKRKGVEMRNMLKARDGYTFIDLDFSGAELRLAAWFTQCKEFLACYIGEAEGLRDVHSATGVVIYNLKEESSLTYEEFVALVDSGDALAKFYRALGKMVNFGMQFGAQAPTLAWNLAVDVDSANLFIKARNKAFPGIEPTVDEYKKLCRERGYALTFLGARRHLSEKYAWKKDKYLQMATDRLAYSHVIQSSSAEQVKIAMGKIVEASGYFEDDSIFPIITIHDEVLLECKDELVDEYVPILHDLVCAPYADMEIVPESEGEIGKSFGKLSKWVEPAV